MIVNLIKKETASILMHKYLNELASEIYSRDVQKTTVNVLRSTDADLKQ